MKALALVEAPDHVCGRYRVSAFAPALDASGSSLEIQGLASGTLARLRQMRQASRFDAVLLQRKLLTGLLLGLLRRNSRRLVFDFDDAVLYRDSYQARGPHSRRRASRFGRIVRAADMVLAGNDFLASCATAHGAPRDRVRVIPTCLDVDRYAPKPGGGGRNGGTIRRLVWVGSSSTLKGLEQRRDLLERLGREFPNLRLRVISDRFPRFDPLPVEAVPWSEAGEATAIAGGDVGISLVPDDLWSRGKCGLKLLQYGAAGLPSVADPVGVHPEILRSGMNGMLANSDDEWVAAVGLLIGDGDLRERMGQAARARVESSYSIAAWAGAFMGALLGLPAAPLPKIAASTMRREAPSR